MHSWCLGSGWHVRNAQQVFVQQSRDHYGSSSLFSKKIPSTKNLVTEVIHSPGRCLEKTETKRTMKISPDSPGGHNNICVLTSVLPVVFKASIDLGSRTWGHCDDLLIKRCLQSPLAWVEADSVLEDAVTPLNTQWPHVVEQVGPKAQPGNLGTGNQVPWPRAGCFLGAEQGLRDQVQWQQWEQWQTQPGFS